ncbi:MAG: hypothetical protein DRH15_07230 [Deltaproteobacteria bacterium]|nr:MAG: hypothetical protein DRH15_07230 [Deltaproteobacteria bacterium]
MVDNKDKPYEKHIYWRSSKEEEGLRQRLASQGMKLKTAKGIMCTPLDRINKIASVPPRVWSETCYRQGGWYRESSKNGLYLIVSSFDLPGYEERKAAIITESDFVPPRLASIRDKEELVGNPELRQRLPKDWLTVEDLEKRIYLRWARRLGSDVNDYDFLYLSHTANHFNFIDPSFYVRSESGIIPYSIDRSAHLCSCCVELFQVLGQEFKEKLVAPCPGATIFARLKPDRYLRVRSF